MFNLTELVGEDFRRYRYLLAVSGGRDSVCMLHAMKGLIPREQLVIAHFDHATDAAYNLKAKRLVRELAEVFRIPGVFGRRSSKKRKVSEDELRNARLAFLERSRVDLKCDWVVTAHHAEDALETFLMRILRGTGQRGLVGILPRRGSRLRPLLPFGRSAVEAYVKKHKLPWVEDPSNQELGYFRNRLRHQLLPVWWNLSEEHGGKERFLERFYALQTQLREWENDRSRWRKKIFQKRVTIHPLYLKMSWDEFSCLRSVWKAELIREVYEYFYREPLSHLSMKYALKFMERKHGKWTAPGNILVTHSLGFIYVQSLKQRKVIEGLRIIRRGGRVECRVLNFSAPLSENSVYRFFRPGDSFKGKKLKEVFLERRIPGPERRLIPLRVCHAAEVMNIFF